MLRPVPLDMEHLNLRPDPAAPMQAIGAPSARTDLAGFMSILGRYRWSILASTLLGLLAAIAYLKAVRPTYTAGTTLLIDPRPKKVLTEDPAQAAVGTDLALLESQISIIRSDAVLGRVVDTLKLDQDPEYSAVGQGIGARIRALLGTPLKQPDPRTLAIATLGDNIAVRRAQKTYVVDIDATSSEPARAAELARAVATAYISDQIAAKSGEAKRANELIDGRLDELRQRVRAAEAKLDEFRRQNSLQITEGGTVGEQQLTRLNSELITARGAATEARARVEEVNAASRSGNFETVTDPAKTALVQRLREQLAQVSRREAALSAQLLPRHPVVLEIRSQATELRAQISAELRRVAQTAKSELAVAERRERELGQALEKTKSEVVRVNTAQIRQRELEQEVTSSRELLRVALTRSKETDEQQRNSTPDARVISPPSVPTRPAKPIPSLVLALGLLGGLGLGVSRALIGDLFDRRVRTPAMASALTGLATIASLPTIPAGFLHGLPRRGPIAGSSGRDPKRSLVEASPLSGIARAASGAGGSDGRSFRLAIVSVLNRVRRRSLARPPHVVLVTGTGPNAGATTTAFAIAHAAATLGDRVLLVDATSSDMSLTTALACPIPEDRVIRLDNVDDLASILSIDQTTGLAVLPIAAADLRTLSSKQRARLLTGLEALFRAYDLAVIDGGPALDDPSSHIVLPVCQEVILVAPAGSTDARALTALAEHMDVARERIGGVVLNRV